MTEADWLACQDPIDMLLVPPGRDADDRRVRLFLVACCRRVWDVMSGENRAAVEVAERAADGKTTTAELAACEERSALYRDVDDEVIEPEDQPAEYWCDVAAWKATARRPLLAAGDVCDATRRVAENRSGEWEEVVQARLLRCVLGNPFRPVALDPEWRSETVVALATGIDQERAFDRMPILADALEEAGCDHPDILTHCRGPGPHARGCWVVDLVLDKS
jgi:hypothetical protein